MANLTYQFSGDSFPDVTRSYAGIVVSNLKNNPPNSTRMVINSNTFNVSDSFDSNGGSKAINMYFFGAISTVSTVITNNKFNLEDGTWGIDIGDISNAHISANQFNGSGLGAVIVRASHDPVSGVTVTANQGLSGFSSTNGYDIVFVRNTSECIVGAGQGASYFNKGTNNTILPQ